ncbi:ABC transporter family substrate-binding protein [Streptomyces sp. NPDC005526]|uniref:ABC transporter family substrate-binding protein n=1 Tax=Streptomyces sp. NPDC005526 TaxID=3156885 RepID=UPI0033AA4C77
MSHDGVGPRALTRALAFLTAGALAVPLLAGCGSDEKRSKPLAGQDIGSAARNLVADGGTLRWAVDAVPQTLNTFQADADAGTTRVAQAVLPTMFRLDANGMPQLDPAYLETARIVETEPKQVVVYRLNQQAVWSDGREIGAADFAAQWRALSGKDTAYWTARNAGYDRIEKVERGAGDLEVKVTFSRPYADWKSLFSPLYPKEVTGTPDTFNDGARKKLQVTAGPFTVQRIDTKNKDVVLARNPRWWGRPAKLSGIVLHAVPRDQRVSALAAGTVDVADVDADDAAGIASAARARGGSPLPGPAGRTAARALREVRLRKSLEPAYTQLALNGADGPLADERVRHAVARALDRGQLAKLVLKPLGLPAVPVGSHLALSGQDAYADNSDALGGQDTARARALLADAGWVPGPVKKEKKGEKAAGATGRPAGVSTPAGDDGTYIVGRNDNVEDHKAGDPADGNRDGDHKDREVPARDRQGPLESGNGHAGEGGGARQLAQDGRQYAKEHLKSGGAPGAYAPRGTAAPRGTSAPSGTAAPASGASGPLAKDGKPLTLRFVLPSGPGSDTLRKVADRISAMLGEVGIGTQITKVPDESYFKDHIAAGQYDLALYSWPTSAFPATDARPIYAKPVPAADGSLNVQQNYTRVGTDQVDQLFDQAVATLDEDEMRALVRRADARIWAAAGSIPLYQRPQLVAVRGNLANVGAFGFRTPVYEDMGFLKKGAAPKPGSSAGN